MSLKVDEKTQVKYQTYPEDASIRIDFASSDDSVFTVSKKGIVTGVHSGTVDLIMTLPNGVQKICAVTVLGKTTSIKSQYGTCYDDKIKLRFNAIEGAVSYKIFRSTNVDGEYSCIAEVKPKDLSGENVLLYTDKNVKADKRYFVSGKPLVLPNK